MTLWPVVEAIGKGDTDATKTLFGVGASVGAGIVSQIVLNWKGKTDAEIQQEASRWIDVEVTTNDGIRRDVDKILTELDAVQHAQTNLSDADREWFVGTLREEAKRLGSTITIVNINTGGGGYIGGNLTATNSNVAMRDQHIYNACYLAPIGNPKLSEAEFKRILNDYLAWVRKAYDTARLYGEESWAASKGKPKRGLGEVFVPVTLREFVPPSRREIE